MASTAIATMVKMMERLPDKGQVELVDHGRECLADLEDEALWDEQFARSQPQLIAAAQRARQEILEGKAQPIDVFLDWRPRRL
jgi:hypothetical protein